MSAMSNLDQDRADFDRLLSAAAKNAQRYLSDIDSRPPATTYVAKSPLALVSKT